MIFIWIIFSLLIIFGILNLVTGASNDAVNFLNSAVGSGVSKRKTIYLVSAAGIFMGVLISNGMMEITRNGIIYPDKFYLTELLSVFIASMMVNIVLIDAFNTLRFPVSTTIALIFELIGGGLAVALIKNNGSAAGSLPVKEIINTDKVLLIFAGIIFSIALSFLIGAIVQFFSRLVFTFNYRHNFKVMLSVVGGLAITAISFMIFKKSAYGIIIEEHLWRELIDKYFQEILITIFAGTTFLFLFLSLSFDVDISRLVVFFGTFALALSFAANDLVNFIGLPLAGFESIRSFFSSNIAAPGNFSLGSLNDNMLTEKIFKDDALFAVYLFSAVVMIVTLFYSRKARGVTETEVYLGRQHPGYERFEPSQFSRFIVKVFIDMKSSLKEILPEKIISFINERYKRGYSEGNEMQKDERFYFDTLRAVVNLTVAGLLISAGTYLKFPLSTTFVVFMVAMGTSLADNAWREDNAVYRVSGVMYILGGWFVSATLALAGSFILTFIIYYGKAWTVIPLTLVLFYHLYKTTVYYREKEKERQKKMRAPVQKEIITFDVMSGSVNRNIRSLLVGSSKVYFLSVKAFVDEDTAGSQKAAGIVENLTNNAKETKAKLFENILVISEEDPEAGNILIQVMDHLSEMIRSLNDISGSFFKHLKKGNAGFTMSQKAEIYMLSEEISSFFNFLLYIIKERKTDATHELTDKQKRVISYIEELRITHLKNIKKGEGSTKANLLFVETLASTKNIILFSVNFIKAYSKLFLHGNRPAGEKHFSKSR